MRLTLVSIVRRGVRRLPTDLRRKCFSVLASYRGDDGEYRKEFLLPLMFSCFQPPAELDSNRSVAEQCPEVLR